MPVFFLSQVHGRSLGHAAKPLSLIALARASTGHILSYVTQFTRERFSASAQTNRAGIM